MVTVPCRQGRCGLQWPAHRRVECVWIDAAEDLAVVRGRSSPLFGPADVVLLPRGRVALAWGGFAGEAARQGEELRGIIGAFDDGEREAESGAQY